MAGNEIGEKEVRLGVIGGGAIAQVVHLPLLKKMSDVRVVALSEMDRQKLQILGRQHGIPKLYPNVEDPPKGS